MYVTFIVNSSKKTKKKHLTILNFIFIICVLFNSRQISSPLLADVSSDFLMCRMFYKSIRQYVKVKYMNNDAVNFKDFVRAGILNIYLRSGYVHTEVIFM